MTSNNTKLPQEILLRNIQGILRPYCHFRQNDLNHSSGSSHDYEIQKNYSLYDPYQYLKESNYSPVLQSVKVDKVHLCASCVCDNLFPIFCGGYVPLCGQVMAGHIVARKSLAAKDCQWSFLCLIEVDASIQDGAWGKLEDIQCMLASTSTHRRRHPRRHFVAELYTSSWLSPTP